MPAVESVSQVLKGLGARAQKAWQTAKSEETEYSKFTQLPPIENGVAQLTQLRFGVFQSGALKGKRFFDGEGVIHSPEEVSDENGVMVKVKGKHTRISPIPLCDTPDRKGEKNTLEHHFSAMCNEIRKLMGVESFDEGTDLADLDHIITQLNQDKPFFKFRVRKGKPTKEYPNPRSWEEWEGRYDAEGNGEAPPFDPGAGTDDSSGGDSEPEPSPAAGTSASMDDLADLIVKAEEGDDSAIEALQKLGNEVGLTDQQITDAPTWTALGELIAGAGTGSGGDEKKDDRLSAPEKGEVYWFKPIDAKTKKPVTKAVQMEVDSVDAKKSTVVGHNLTNPKVKYKDVPFASLSREEPGK